MKKIVLVLILVVALAFVAASCAKETKVVVTEGTPSAEQKTTQTTTAKTTTTASIPNTQALEQDGLNCLELGVRVCRPVNIKDGSVGDTVGFALGIANLDNTAKKFAIKTKFVRTQQSVGQSGIEADKDYVSQWLAVNDIESFYELQPNQKLSKPILVKIGDSIGDGKPTTPGTYVFEIQVQTYDRGFYENYEGAQQISVRVK